ncbi:MAG: alpha-hydroxy acid oxidase [Gammaproteobacteria bacterium]|nr:alpha-hydroxy acid oxidase [Gammaproteobacteria bacterium]
MELPRRHFLRWLAASPILASAGGLAAFTEVIDREPNRRVFDDLVSSAEKALDVFDLERVAAQKVPTAHWGYLQTDVDGGTTLANNREGLRRIYLRARRLIDVSELDTSVNLFGRQWASPLMLAPASSQRAFHAAGELATARAAAANGSLMTLATPSSTTVEAVIKARGEPVWFQLYPPARWEDTVKLITRTRAAGCPVIVLTVDLYGGTNRLTAERYKRSDKRDCDSCHIEGGAADPVKPMLRGFQQAPVAEARVSRRAITWDYVNRLRDVTDQKIIVKGLVTREDAELAAQNGIDAIWVSNHGGRAEDSGRATIDALPEIHEAIAGRMPIIVDSGFRRGSDLFKGIARGATAVAIGRPYLWGLGAFGQEGVDRVLNILTRELEITMGAAGTPSLASIGPHSIGTQ